MTAAELWPRAGVLLGVLARLWRPALLLAAGGLIAAMLALVPGAGTGGASPSGGGSISGGGDGGGGAHGPVTAGDRRRPPNIVYVLTDDLSRDLVRHMPAVRAMQRRGVSFRNFFVSDSLCCPARSTILTGDFPHDTGVFTNVGRDGGIKAFYRHDDEDRSFNVYLQQAGYRTGFMGKYLNGYLQGRGRSPVADTYVPPGWDEWDAAGYAYPEFDYELNEDGRLHHYGDRPQDYLTDVIARRGADFVRSSARTGRPFFLELASFAPHQPYTPAPRDRHAFRHLRAPRPRAYDRLPTHPVKWLQGHRPLTAGNERYIDRVYRKRVQSVQAIDDLIARLRRALRATGQLDNTYVVFNSDNGLHTGEYRLMPGKLTAFDTDDHVPLVIDGPGVPHGARTSGMALNTDLAPTFEQIAGTSAPCDGHTLLPLMSGGAAPADWRDAILVEHHGPDLHGNQVVDPGDPDQQNFAIGNPTTYEAMRTPRFLYVEYSDGEREYYDLRRDPAELHNVAGRLAPDRIVALHAQLAAMRDCHDGSACWAAEHVPR